jgi:hypothetical protein
VVYRILGLACVAGAAGLLILVAASLALLSYYRRTGRVLWPRLSACVGGLLYSPLCVVLRLFGKPTQVLDLLIIDAVNAVLADRYAQAGPSRLLVMPQCLRAGDCQATLHPELGYQCRRCGKCLLGELSEAAEAHGFRFFIVPGDRYARRLIRQFAADAALGVACPCELSLALVAGMRMGVAAQGVPLATDGCFETAVDAERVKEALRRCGSSSST